MYLKKNLYKYIMEIDDILNTLSNSSIENKIRKKWKNELKNYKYIKNSNSDIGVGKYIKYADLNLNNLKYGILVNITHHHNGNSIKYLTLKNTSNNTIWKIKFAKYHIFQSERAASFFRQLLDKIKKKKYIKKNLL